MAKRIAFSILCTLLVLVVILTGIVIRRVSRILLWSQPESPIPTDTPASPTDSSHNTDPTQPQHAHTFELTNTIDPSCEGVGWKIYTCTTCGHVDMPEAEQLPPLGHNYVESEVIPATCTEGGHTVYVCLRCIRIITGDETAPLGHAFDLQTEVPPTCTEDGYTIISCSHEGCAEIQDTIPHKGTATGHIFGAWSNLEDELAVQFCDGCGAARPLGEDYIILPDVYTVLYHTRTDLIYPTGDPYAFYEIRVGIVNKYEAERYDYTIYDFLNNGSLTFHYDPERGLVLQFTDKQGAQQEVVLDPQSNQSATIRNQ